MDAAASARLTTARSTCALPVVGRSAAAWRLVTPKTPEGKRPRMPGIPGMPKRCAGGRERRCRAATPPGTNSARSERVRHRMVQPMARCARRRAPLPRAQPKACYRGARTVGAKSARSDPIYSRQHPPAGPICKLVQR